MSNRAELFWTGRGQAIRLTEAYRFEGTEVRIRRERGGVFMEAVEDEDPLAWLYRLKPLDEDAAAAALEPA